MFKLTNWFRKEEEESKEGDINAVNFSFNPNILVVRTIICCLAYVKLQPIFMRPLLKKYKLCKYMNKFCVSFHLILPALHTPTPLVACPQEALRAR